MQHGNIQNTNFETLQLSRHNTPSALARCLEATKAQYAVKLCNVGNPDFRQDYTRPLPGTRCGWAHVNTLRECAEICRAYIVHYELGGGNWNGGEIVRADGLVVGKVSFNGRVWDTNEKEIAV